MAQRTQNPVEVGQRVSIVVPDTHPLRSTQWYPKGEATGTVQRLYKNGQVLVAVDQIRNRSEDGLKSLQFELSHLTFAPQTKKCGGCGCPLHASAASEFCSETCEREAQAR